MFKIIFIAALLGVFVFFIFRRLGILTNNNTRKHLPSHDWIHVELSNAVLKKATVQTLITVGVGFVILIVTLVLAAKFKIILILLPVSFYLIGQYFILLNQIRAARRLDVFYNPKTSDLQLKSQNSEVFVNMNNDVIRVTEVRAVQKNSGILFGYYLLTTSKDSFFLPFILEEDPQNKTFFNRLQVFSREIETKLFPII